MIRLNIGPSELLSSHLDLFSTHIMPKQNRTNKKDKSHDKPHCSDSMVPACGEVLMGYGSGTSSCQNQAPPGFRDIFYYSREGDRDHPIDMTKKFYELWEIQKRIDHIVTTVNASKGLPPSDWSSHIMVYMSYWMGELDKMQRASLLYDVPIKEPPTDPTLMLWYKRDTMYQILGGILNERSLFVRIPDMDPHEIMAALSEHPASQ